MLQKNSHILLISPFICSFFFLSNGNFCHTFLSSYWSQCFQILCTPSGRLSVLCNWKLRCLSSFSLLFSIFHFFLLSLLYNTYRLFSVKDFSATTWVRILKFGTKLDSDELYCVTKEQPHIAYQSLYLFIFLSLQWKFLSQVSQLLLELVFSNFVYIFRKAKSTV